MSAYEMTASTISYCISMLQHMSRGRAACPVRGCQHQIHLSMPWGPMSNIVGVYEHLHLTMHEYEKEYPPYREALQGAT